MDYDYDGYENDLLSEGDLFYHNEEDGDYEGIEYGAMTWQQILTSCVWPTLHQTYQSLTVLLVWNIVFRLSTQIVAIPTSLQHLASVICGIFALYSIFANSFLLLLLYCSISYIPQRLRSNRGPWLLGISSVLLILYELVWLDARVWHQVQGPQMVLIMKAVSLAFDLDIGTVKDPPNILEYGGYLLSPGTCIFGPWTSYLDYLNIYKKPRWRLSWLRDIGISCSLSLVFLTISTCILHYLLPETSWIWLAAYRDAFSFRCSHYFVCYFSETTLLLSGYTKLGQEETIAVSRPLQVEVPRSLIQVVVSWNIPMHSWLKIYVFNTSRGMGNFIAVIATYAVSALLHGLNFQLGAVLLSLGFYSYVEFMLRRKLCNIFNACIQARPCRTGCSHVYKWNHPGVLAVNLFCGLVALLHLAYLGVMFDSSEASDTGYSYEHTLRKWADLSYLSHFLALFTYIMYFLI